MQDDPEFTERLIEAEDIEDELLEELLAGEDSKAGAPAAAPTARDLSGRGRDYGEARRPDRGPGKAPSAAHRDRAAPHYPLVGSLSMVMNGLRGEHRHRRSIRLKGYDYARSAAYFVTICSQDRVCLFGEVVGARMHMSEAGRMVQTVWDAIPNIYPGVDIDQFIIMPNHLHGIIILTCHPTAVMSPDPLVGAGPHAIRSNKYYVELVVTWRTHLRSA